MQVIDANDTAQYNSLLQHLSSISEKHAPIFESTGERVLIGVIGTPGSGKTTMSQRISKDLHQHPAITIALSMDGFHYSRRELERMEDPEAAFRERGAPYTFDVERLWKCLSEVKHQSKETLGWPTFDHAVKDPEEDGVLLQRGSYPLILVEGNYLGLQQAPWHQLVSPLFNCFLLTYCPLETAAERVWKRHLAAGICSDEQSARDRWTSNDSKNANLILNHLPQKIDFKLVTA